MLFSRLCKSSELLLNKKRILLFFFTAVNAVSVTAVWPMPQKISSSIERYCVRPQSFIFQYTNVSIAQPGCSILDAAFVRYFKLIFPDLLRDPGERQIYYARPMAKPFTVWVGVSEGDCNGYPSESSKESYRLSVSSGQALLRAESVWGALRGLESLSQLVYQDGYGAYYINQTEIEDFPRFPFRGLLLDTSRHYLPINAILETLDAMAYTKLNVFHWHIVDDPSFPYQSKSYPDLSNKGAFHPMTHVYTQTDVKRVIEHARLRGIRVVPEFDSPGHTQSWGKGKPDLLTPCYRGDVPSGTFGPVNPILASSYSFMAKLLKEVTSVFPDSFLHLGGDEVNFSCWRSNPDVRAFMKKMGFGTDFTKLEALYVENMVSITSALNRTSIVWQDVFDYHEKHSRNYVVEVWKMEGYQCKMGKVTKAGLKAILAAPWYLDLPGPTHEWARYYNVRPLAFRDPYGHGSGDLEGPSPGLRAGAEPHHRGRPQGPAVRPLLHQPHPLRAGLARLLPRETTELLWCVERGTEEQKRLVIGGEVCMWGEYVDATNLSPRLWPRGCAAAERLWSDEEQTSSVDAAFPRLTDFRCRLLRRGIRAEPLFVGHCQQEYQGL
ncbi:beta-hexosaminidase subunit alpha isoform X1 [Alosa sapidissima]|uniref:beta-hexosaminidase subunit alpha isoform X1 n=1 Tax=Alosa sapidissima TaxID=34773 RepID=UPI001C089A29|nr:beta-hexosaminidase subunit alpha isoform X1 [Alosa sapidissima]